MGSTISIDEEGDVEIKKNVPNGIVNLLDNLEKNKEKLGQVNSTLPEAYNPQTKCTGYFNRMYKCQQRQGDCSEYKEEFLRCCVIAGMDVSASGNRFAASPRVGPRSTSSSSSSLPSFAPVPPAYKEQ